MPHDTSRDASRRLTSERERVRLRYGKIDSDEEEHIRKMHSKQPGDISLDKPGNMDNTYRAIEGLRKTFGRFSPKEK